MAGARHHSPPSQLGRARKPGWIAVLAVGWATGCALSPKPEPPDAVPTLDLEATSALPSNADARPLSLVGGPGAVDPAGATIRLYRLEGDEMVEATVDRDGSFLLEGVADDGDDVRVVVLTDDRRSAPVDLRMTATWGPIEAVTHPLADCLTLTPALELDLAERQTVEIRSTCEAPVTVVAPRTRVPWAELQLGTDLSWPLTLNAGDSVSLTVTLSGPSSFEEEIFFVETTTPEPDQRAITVRAP